MSYIICAEVYPDEEVNMGAERDKVDAAVLNEREGYITFYVPGKFGEEKARTLQLCTSLINAGYSEFRIRHSF